MADYNFYGWYTAAKTGKTGLTVTCTVYGPGGTEASAQSATEVGGGLYSYTHTDATPGDYTAVFATADTSVDAQHVPALAVKQISAYLDAAITTRPSGADYTLARAIKLDNLDATVGSRSSHSAADVWDVLLAGHVAVGTTGKKLDDLCCSLGGGANTFVYTVTDSNTGLPLQGVQVIVTTDVAGNNEIAQSNTDAFGQVTFQFDSGTYYFWRLKSGYLFSNPDQEVIP